MVRRISVIGAGYVGLVTAACFAELGYRVTLLEIDPERLDALSTGCFLFMSQACLSSGNATW